MSAPDNTLPVCSDWYEFFNRNSFSWPNSNDYWLERSYMNLGYYRGNYTYIGLFIIVIAALSSPIFYIIYALFFFALRRIKSQPEICIGELHLDRPQAGLLLVVVTLFLLLVFGGETFFKVILLLLMLTLLHATFHKRPVHANVASFWNELWGTKETNPMEDPMSTLPVDGWTPLHSACANGDKVKVQRLLERNASVEAKDSFGWTPLHTACVNEHKEVAQLLLERNANVKAKDSTGRSPLDWCTSDEIKQHLREAIQQSED